MRSPHFTSSIEPTEAKWENPTFSLMLQSRMAVHRAPLWLRKATLRGRAIFPAKVALRPLTGLITPRQLGPTMRILPRLASSRTCCSSSAPTSPASLKPAEMTMAPSTPASAHSRMIPGTVGAGETMTARSTCSGTSRTLGYAFIPRTLDRFGLTGKTVPPNGLPIRLRITVRPTLPALSVAPITASVSGRKITSRGCRSYLRTSCAGSPAGGFFMECSSSTACSKLFCICETHIHYSIPAGRGDVTVFTTVARSYSATIKGDDVHTHNSGRGPWTRRRGGAHAGLRGAGARGAGGNDGCGERPSPQDDQERSAGPLPDRAR